MLPHGGPKTYSVNLSKVGPSTSQAKAGTDLCWKNSKANVSSANQISSTSRTPMPMSSRAAATVHVLQMKSWESGNNSTWWTRGYVSFIKVFSHASGPFDLMFTITLWGVRDFREWIDDTGPESEDLSPCWAMFSHLPVTQFARLQRAEHFKGLLWESNVIVKDLSAVPGIYSSVDCSCHSYICCHHHHHHQWGHLAERQ